MNLHVNVSSPGILPRTRRQAQRFVIATCVLSLLAFSSVAFAIDLGGGLNGPFTFDDPPPATDWTAFTLSGAAGTITSQAALTTAVQARTAASISSALPTDPAAAPVINNGTARWNSSLFALETGPTGTAAQFLMGKFVNASDNFISDFLVSYDVATFPTPAAAEDVGGHAVYYSLTGAANSWIPMDNGAGGNNFGASGGFVSFFATGLGQTWGNNPLYMLWVDDNGPPSDSVFTIDNLTFETVLGDPKEPPPPPTPEFGNITPPQLQDFEVAGAGFPLNNTGGTVVTLVGTQALQVNNGSIVANPDQVDLRGLDAGLQKVVSVDLKAWETSQTSDFEAADRITITADISQDGLAFTTITLLDLRGAPILDPFDPTVANPADQLRATFGPIEAVNNADQPFRHFDFVLPATANTVRLHIDMVNDSGSEFMAIDNVRIAAVPEPATLAMLGLGMIGLVGYNVRRRIA